MSAPNMDRDRMLEAWIGLAVANGDQLAYRAPDHAVMKSGQVQRANHTAWGVGAVLVVALGIATGGIGLILFLPYLIMWAARSRKGRRVDTYTLSIGPDLQPVTNPSGSVWRLRGFARQAGWSL